MQFKLTERKKERASKAIATKINSSQMLESSRFVKPNQLHLSFIPTTHFLNKHQFLNVFTDKKLGN
jgi:hypothetical protein